MRYLFLLLLIAQSVAAQQTKRVLFLGNSYTYYNSYAVATIMQEFALQHGDTVIYSANAPGGYTLQGHSTNATSLSLIRQGNWDYVVLQEQSQKPSFPPAQVATEVYPYAAALNDTIEKYNPCAETVFFMTWGRKNGDAMNCSGYPILCTYYGMQLRLRESYLEMTQDNNGICAPVGAAWQLMRSTYPGVDLYIADESHPSYAGSYLAASVFYATLFRRSPEGMTFYGTLADTVAQQLQWAAAQATLDSINLWHITDYDVVADFSSNVANGNADFSNNSSFATQFWWDFGDGSPSSSDANPSHVYAAEGVYPVVLIASDTCGNSDTIAQSIVVQCIPSTTPIADFTHSISSDTVYFSNNSSNANTYFWDFGDGQTATDANPMHIFAANGDYTVMLVVTDTCGRTDTSYQIIQIVLNAVNPLFDEEAIRAFPNPVHQGELSIIAPFSISGVRVFNVLGQQLAYFLVSNTNQTQIAFDFPRGIYLLHIQTEKGDFQLSIEN